MIKQFYQKYKGKKIDYDKKHGFQCVDLFRQFIKEQTKIPQPKGVNGAIDFYTKYDQDEILKKHFKKMYLPAHCIEQNDIFILPPTKSNPFGHIAIVYFVENNDITVIEQDGYAQTGVQVKTYTVKDYARILRLNENPQKTASTAKKSTITALLSTLLLFGILFCSCSTLSEARMSTDTAKINEAHGKITENINTAKETTSNIKETNENINTLITELEKTNTQKEKPANKTTKTTGESRENKTQQKIITELKQKTTEQKGYIKILEYELNQAELNTENAEDELKKYKTDITDQINQLTEKQIELLNENKRLKKTIKSIIFSLITVITITITIITYKIKAKLKL